MTSCASEKSPTRVVIRGLPKNVTEKELLHRLHPLPQYNHFYVVSFKYDCGIVKSPRAYINFNNYDAMLLFIRRNHLLEVVGAKGKERGLLVIIICAMTRIQNCEALLYSEGSRDRERCRLTIEIAQNQRVIPRRRNKPDPKIATIESDKIYRQFLEEIRNEERVVPNVPFELHLKRTAESTDTTPLLKYIYERKIRRESRAKNDCVIFINSSKKKQRNKRCRSPANKLFQISA